MARAVRYGVVIVSLLLLVPFLTEIRAEKDTSQPARARAPPGALDTPAPPGALDTPAPPGALDTPAPPPLYPPVLVADDTLPQSPVAGAAASPPAAGAAASPPAAGAAAPPPTAVAWFVFCMMLMLKLVLSV